MNKQTFKAESGKQICMWASGGQSASLENEFRIKGKWKMANSTKSRTTPASSFVYPLSGFRLYSILFRFRNSKFEEGWSAGMAIRIQLDNILSWVRRDISRRISSITTQLSWQIYKSRRHSLLEVSFEILFCSRTAIAWTYLCDKCFLKAHKQ